MKFADDAYDRVKVGTYSDGSPMLVNKRTQAMLTVAAEKLGYDLTLAQGSYHTGVSASAGTHDGGGVVDLLAYDAKRKVRALRKVGFAAWHRLPSQGPWPEHIHAVAIGDREMAPLAKAQVVDFLANPPRDGLAGHAIDRSWHPDPPVKFSYMRWQRDQARDAGRARRFAKAIGRALNRLRNARKLTDDHATRAQIDDVIDRLQRAREEQR